MVFLFCRTGCGHRWMKLVFIDLAKIQALSCCRPFHLSIKRAVRQCVSKTSSLVLLEASLPFIVGKVSSSLLGWWRRLCVCVDQKNCHHCVCIPLPLDAVSSLPLGLPPSSQISYFVAVVAKAFACVSNRCRAIVAFNGT